MLDDVQAGRSLRSPSPTVSTGQMPSASPLSPSTAHALFATVGSSSMDGKSQCRAPAKSHACIRHGSISAPLLAQPPLSPSKARSPLSPLSPQRKSLASSLSLKKVRSYCHACKRASCEVHLVELMGRWRCKRNLGFSCMPMRSPRTCPACPSSTSRRPGRRSMQRQSSCSWLSRPLRPSPRACRSRHSWTQSTRYPCTHGHKPCARQRCSEERASTGITHKPTLPL